MLKATQSWKDGFKAAAPLTPTIFLIFAGFGMAATLAGTPPGAAMLMTAVMFAAPAQFAILDMAASSPAGVIQLAVVGVMANLRFFVMGLWMAHAFERVPRRKLLAYCHFVAATPFLLVYLRARKEERGNLFEYYQGICAMMAGAPLAGVALGLAAGGFLPGPLKYGVGLFMPIYFSLLLLQEMKGRREIAAIALGAILTPLVEKEAPGWGLLLGPAIAGLSAARMRP